MAGRSQALAAAALVTTLAPAALAQSGTETAQLTKNAAAFGDRFGSSAAISGNMAVVGAPYDGGPGSEIGSAYVFENP